MKSFKSLLEELKSNKPKSAVFTFGRFQGLTIGHEKLLNDLLSREGVDHFVFISQTHDDSKNPLSPEYKQKLLKSLYSDHSKAFSIEFRTPIEALQHLIDSGYTDIKMIVGDDRVESFKNAFNGFDFPVSVINAGDRSEEGTSIQSSSASELRDAARSGSLKEFTRLSHSGLNYDQKLDMFNQIRKTYGKDKVEVSKAEKIREDYISGKIFNIGDYVAETAQTFKVIDRGSNYVRVVSPDGTVSRKWLTDIEPKRTLDKTFAESFEQKKQKFLTFNGYVSSIRLNNKDVVEAFNRTIESSTDQYAILESLKATESLIDIDSDIKTQYESFNRAGRFLSKLNVIDHHKSYRKLYEEQLVSGLLENLDSLGEILDHDKKRLVEFFSSIVGVRMTAEQEETITKCINKLNNLKLTEKSMTIYSDIIDVLLEEGLDIDVSQIRFLKNREIDVGSDTDMILWCESVIDTLTFDDIISLYEDSDIEVKIDDSQKPLSILESVAPKKTLVSNPLDDKKIHRKAKQIAVQYMKQRNSRKAVDRLTTSEKKKIEEIVSKKGSILTMISRKLGKKVRQIEDERLVKTSPQPIIEAPQIEGGNREAKRDEWKSWESKTRSREIPQALISDKNTKEIISGGYLHDAGAKKIYFTISNSKTINAFSVIINNKQTAVSKGSEKTSDMILEFMLYHCKTFGYLRSDEQQTEGSRNLWLKFISILPKDCSAYVVDNRDLKNKVKKSLDGISQDELNSFWGPADNLRRVYFEVYHNDNT